MKKTLGKTKLTAFILLLIEIVVATVFGVFYYLNLFEIQNLVSVEIIYIVGASFVVVNAIFIWTVILIISSLRHKTNLHAADLIGGDIQEAYKCMGFSDR